MNIQAPASNSTSSSKENVPMMPPPPKMTKTDSKTVKTSAPMPHAPYQGILASVLGIKYDIF